MEKFDFIIIGGGFFGAYISCYLRQQGKSVLLIEEEKEIMTRASFANQARIHNGYHYPRSRSTAIRSRALSPRFKEEFKNSITGKETNHYLIAKHLSKVSSLQFKEFCRQIEAPLREAQEKVKKLVNPNLIENIFEVEEFAFDAFLLRNQLSDQLANLNTVLKCSSRVIGIKDQRGEFEVSYEQGSEIFSSKATQVINCTYSMLNQVNGLAGYPAVALKHELTEICLVRPPEELSLLGFTTMCGPFFSFTKFPALDLHALTHVRYTPHSENMNEDLVKSKLSEIVKQQKSAFTKMLADASRFIPMIALSEYKESIWEIKTVLPQNEVDDGRPILLKLNHGAKGFHCILGGKVDNIYDAINIIEKRLI